ncbi:hybrid sensor histidine kinase/response regulator [Streptomyces sp. OfavH-34-F]|uniref:ATP-binding response regulator n=1 Tax=Streptomyces sp. OfavH-34-F TaxID=2917760 RepID=UPI001EF18767|nr:hybrid sensor histidine kinase/response regulator [Streptomyces sp. OfavH-34-F]MCG7523924.1 hybrid sensor histidine kinase/response regulator [Streptomyces sp. OfavH-34-F]
MNSFTALGVVPLVSFPLATEQDVFLLRRSGKSAAEALGVEKQDQIRLATALSELGRDLLGSDGLTVAFGVARRPVPVLLVGMEWAQDRALGGEALQAASRLVTVRYTPPRHTVTVEQPLTPDGRTAEAIEHAREAVLAHAETGVPDDTRAQTSDLIAALVESRAQREELRRLNEELEETNRGVVALYSELSEELEETNRGVVALYAELEEKSRLLREASEAKTRFWANVSHELRTPVNSVVGLARLLLEFDEDRLDEEQRRQIGLISASGATLLALVDELLDVAKAESGRLEPHWAPVDLRAALGQLRGTLRGYGSPGAAELIVAGSAPNLVTDEVMLTRILRNLLSNALKFTPAGTVRLDVAPERADGHDRVVFTVSDTGIGIPAEEQQQIFEEFYQVRGPHQRGRSGTGLGLPYARRLTELLGGSLALTSTPGTGTVVTVTLPADGRPAARSGAGEPAGAPEPLVAVLVTVDDDSAFRASIRPLLDQLAGRVVEVSEGGRASAAVRREQPDAVLLDLHLPDLDGYAVLAELAADPALAAVPVLVLTSTPSGELDRDRLTHARAVLDKSALNRPGLAAALTAARTPTSPHTGRKDDTG